MKYYIMIVVTLMLMSCETTSEKMQRRTKNIIDNSHNIKCVIRRQKCFCFLQYFRGMGMTIDQSGDLCRGEQ